MISPEAFQGRVLLHGPLVGTAQQQPVHCAAQALEGPQLVVPAVLQAVPPQQHLHLRRLPVTLFYRFMPELIYEGHVYIAMPPLYKAMPTKGEEEYLYDDAALARYRKTHKGSFTLQRYKGLGEMDAQQLWETTLNPETRMLKQVEIEDARMVPPLPERLWITPKNL